MPRSFSQLQNYLMCPRQYEYGYVKKVPRGPISAGESFGTSMHNTLKKWGEIEISRQKTGGSNQLELFIDDASVGAELSLETLLGFWKQSFVVEGYESRVDADQAMKRGGQILEQYFEYWQQEDHHILAVEKGFKLGIDGASISGRFDRVEQIEGGIKIIDFKTSKPRSQDEVDADLQLSVYAMACQKVFDQPCVSLSFLFLNEEGVSEMLTTRSEKQLKDAKNQITTVDERILSKDFAPTPGAEVCRRCPYRNVCDSAAC